MSIFGLGGGFDNMVLESEITADKAIKALQYAKDCGRNICDPDVQREVFYENDLRLSDLTSYDIDRINRYFN